jgi:hypothetical protein
LRLIMPSVVQSHSPEFVCRLGLFNITDLNIMHRLAQCSEGLYE